jgi:hypothetical protein
MNTQIHKPITLTFGDLTAIHAKALLDAHVAQDATGKRGRKTPEATTTEDKDEIDVSTLNGKKRKPRAKFSSGPESEEAEEEQSEEEETEEEEESEEEESEEEEEETDENVSFNDVKAAIDKYGEKKPKAMKTLLASFNLKSTIELKKAKKKWAPVLRKINATFGKK